MSEPGTARGKVVVNRSMSLDGFIAGPGHSMDWGVRSGFVDPADIAEIASATGAMVLGRRTWDIGDRLEADEPGSTDYPFSGPTFLLTHRPLDPPDPDVTILSGDIGQAVATALAAAGIRFSAPGLARVQLEPISSARSGEATILRFRVRR